MAESPPVHMLGSDIRFRYLPGKESMQVMNVRIAGLVAVAIMIGGAAASLPTPDVALVTATEKFCGPSYLCATDPAPDGGDQGTAERRIVDGYVAKQSGCTPDLAANPKSVHWDPPGFTPFAGGSGDIVDANPALGGHFAADYVNGRWHVVYMYC